MIRVAIAQAEVQPTLDAGLAATVRLIGDASAAGAGLVVFPETWLPGYPAWLDVCRDVALWDHEPVKRVFRRMAEESVVVPGPVTEALGAAARDAGVVLVIGVTERIDAGPSHGTLYNAALTFDADGRLVNHHRKLVPTYTERMVWGLGDADGLTAVETQGRTRGRARVLGALDAARAPGDARFGRGHSRRALADRARDAAGREPALRVRGALLRSRGGIADARVGAAAGAGAASRARFGRRATGCFAAAARSSDRTGVTSSSRVSIAPTLIVSDIDLGRVREERMTLDVSGHYHRPELLRLEIDRSTRR